MLRRGWWKGSLGRRRVEMRKETGVEDRGSGVILTGQRSLGD